MKAFITTLSFVLFCIQLSAQEKIDAFQLIRDVCENNISVDDFKYKYIDYFTKDQDKNITDLGIFSLKNISFAGYESDGMVIINPAEELRTVKISPNHNVLDSISRYQVADNCHEYLIAALGQPHKEENISSADPTLDQIPEDFKIKEGKNYKWFNNNIVHVSVRYNNNEEDLYFVMAISIPSLSSTTTPIQRQFFKTLELGNYITKMQIANGLGIASFEIREERKSSGKSYHYWDSVYFGGIEWSFIEISTVESKLATVRLTSSQIKDNRYIYNELIEALTNKYGEPNDKNEEPNDDETWICWNDGTTGVILSYTFSESRGGEMRHYVNLEYWDLKLHKEAQNIIKNEL